jgi:hypothetical protein
MIDAAAARAGRTDSVDVVNDASTYGVRVEVATAQPGALWRWQCVRVHHLAQNENNGNHNLFVDVLGVDGKRERGHDVWLTWPGNVGFITIDKPDNEPGGNAPLWKWQVVSCGVKCGPNEVTDVVLGITTEHPDEPPGNTLFHHSFLCVWRRVALANNDPLPPPKPGPVDPAAAPAKYWGWVETTAAGLNQAMYQLHLLASAHPGLAEEAVAGVEAVTEKLSHELQ